MTRQVLPDPQVQAALRSYTFVELDADDEVVGEALDAWGAEGVPFSAVFLPPDEVPAKVQGGFMDATKLIAFLR
jgi:thiol:disulfide interchange protein